MTLRMRVLPRFPAKISAGAGIKVARALGSADLVVSVDVSNLVRVPSVSDGDKVFFLAWNSDLNSYSIMSFTDTFAAVIDTTGLMLQTVYDPQGIEEDAFDRSNHTGTQATSTIAGLDDALDLKISGPVSSVDGRFMVFNGGAGKEAKEATVAAPSLIGATGSGPVVPLNKAQANQVIGGWEVIASDPLNAVTAWARTDLGVFRMLRLTAAIENSAESGILLRVSNDNGANWASGATAYTFFTSQRSSGPTTTFSSGTVSGLSLQGGGFSFSVFNAEIFEFNNSSRFTHSFAKGNRGISGLGQVMFETKSSFETARAENAIQLINVNGATMSGFITLEGVRG